MSTPALPLRTRVPRIASEAVGRARLTVVPRIRSRAPRIPFVTLVSLVMLAGVVGLLMFNTSMQKASFTALSLEEQAKNLAAREQTLQMELDQLNNPQRVAAQAQSMGMVIPAAPAFLNLKTGRIEGTATPALPDNALRLEPAPVPKPAILNPAPKIIKVKAKPGTSASGKTRAGGKSRRGSR